MCLQIHKFLDIPQPFQFGESWAEELNKLNLPGVYFRPVWFTPLSSTNANKLCSGVEVHVTDRTTFESVYTGWAMLYVVRTMYPTSFTMNKSTINVNTGCNYISNNTYNLEELHNIIKNDTIEFMKVRKNYLLY